MMWNLLFWYRTKLASQYPIPMHPIMHCAVYDMMSRYLVVSLSWSLICLCWVLVCDICSMVIVCWESHILIVWSCILFCAICDRLLPSPSQPVVDREDTRRAPSQVVIYGWLHIATTLFALFIKYAAQNSNVQPFWHEIVYCVTLLLKGHSGAD